MKGNRAKDTKPELLVRRLLREAGYPGYRLHWRRVAGRPDIAYPGRRIAIFVHGCFWHRCPHCQPALPKSNTDFWRLKFEANQARDLAKTTSLQEAGWTVFTLWECRIDAEIACVLEALASK